MVCTHSCSMRLSFRSLWGRPPGRCELIEAVSAADGSRKKLRVCRPYKQSVGPRDTLHIPGICAPFSESRLIHIFPWSAADALVGLLSWVEFEFVGDRRVPG